MTKAKTAADKAAANAEFAMANGTEAFKAVFDKAIKNYDAVLGYGKETAEAVMKSATVAGKGVESINSEIYAYSKSSLEESIMGSKSLHEAFEYQSDFAKSAFESYIAEMTKFGELFTATTKSSFARLQGRAESWLDVVQSSKA